MEKLLLVDGNSILNRAYYGIRPLTAPDGTPTNAVYGFLNILFKYIEEENPNYLCIAFDVKAKTFRHKMYELYKAQRKPAPEDFIAQIPVIKEVLGAMNCICIEKEGYEADDLIGTVSLLCEKKGIECRILTGDKDDLQLASPKTIIKLVITRMGSTTTTDYGDSEVMEKYGVTPEEFIDVKGLMGDASDNIPGVKGIGEKTALDLIGKYKSIQNIYDEIDSLDITESVRKKLAADRDNAFLSRTLAAIDRNVPINIDFEDFRVKEANRQKTAELFTRLNFKSFMQKMNLSAVSAAESNDPIFAKALEIHDVFEYLPAEGKMDYFLDSNDLFFTADSEKVYCVKNIEKDILKKIFENDKILKCGCDIKSDILKLNSMGINMQGVGFDVMLAAYLAESTRQSYDIDTLCITYLGRELSASEIRAEADGQIPMNFTEKAEDNREEYSASRVMALNLLRRYFEKKLTEEGQSELYYSVELPLAEVLADMQILGVYVDKKELEKFGGMLSKRIAELRNEIYEMANGEFNINSPKQLGEVLFERLKLPGGKKNKTGYSTNADVLNRLSDKHPIINSVMEFRKLSKLQSTYVEGLLQMINAETGRIHSSFNQTVTATGRISSTEPNLQNIPVRTEIGREIRKMFAAEGEDTCLIDADYSQIELRVLAHISDDENMKKAFTEGADIHTQTASQVFGVPADKVTSVMRSRAKAVNFGIVYGIGAFSLAQDLKIPVKEADAYIKGYLSHYPKVDEYMKKTVSEAKEKGCVVTMFGRKRNMPELKASSRVTQAFGERAAMNAPIQGTAADIIKMAMVRVYRRLKSENLKARLILQVHDELIVEAPTSEKERAAAILREEMENACELSVPLVVDMNAGKSWYDTK